MWLYYKKTFKKYTLYLGNLQDSSVLCVSNKLPSYFCQLDLYCYFTTKEGINSLEYQIFCKYIKRCIDEKKF